MSVLSETKNRWIAEEYFRRVDAGMDVSDLFEEDIEFYYPKFGRTTGIAAFGDFVGGIMGKVSEIVHPLQSMNFIEQGDTVVVEGLFNGQMATGQRWTAGETPTGRFCSVFQFRHGRIGRMHIYVDPDYGSTNEAGFLWGRERNW